LGYGVAERLATTVPEEVIEQIRQHGGIAVIAHPKDSHFPWIESFQQLPCGIEAWNSKYDGRYAPRPATFALVQRLQQRQATLLAFYGTDLHWRRQYRGLLTEVDCQTTARDDILAALSRGRFCGVTPQFRLPSSGRLPQRLASRFEHLRRFSNGVRYVLG